MQRKKDEMREGLLQAAREEFLKKGFNAASIRTIVKSATTTIGNFYNYFSSKEIIFSALVDEVYQEFFQLIESHHEFEERSELMASMDDDLLRQFLTAYVSPIIPKLNDDFLLLIEYSYGTKYENVKEELILFLGGHFNEHIVESNPEYEFPEMGKILATQFLSGMIEIIKSGEAIKKQQDLMVELIIFTGIGVIGLIERGTHD